jgi:hypothetical protein
VLPPWTTNADLASLAVGPENLTSLSLHAHAVWDLSPLAPLTGLKRLDLSDCVSVYDLRPLAKLTGLQTLDLCRCASLSDLSPLADLADLRDVDVRGCDLVTDLPALRATVHSGPDDLHEFLRARGMAADIPHPAAPPARADGQGAPGGPIRHPTMSPEELERAAQVAFGLQPLYIARHVMVADTALVVELERFLTAYRLEPGQNVKLIGQPFIPERQAYSDMREELWPRRGTRSPDMMAFQWRDGCLKWRSSTYGRTTLGRLLRSALGLGGGQIDGSAKILDTVVHADLVYRPGVAPEDMLPEIERELLAEALLPVRLTFQDADRKAVFVSGSYRYAPAIHAATNRSYDQIHIYGSLPREDPSQGGGGSGTFREFLDWVGEYTDRPILADVQKIPGMVEWREGPLPEGVRRWHLPDEEVALVLRHLGEQTGLTFTEETRKIPVLYVDVDLPPDFH